jgi:hypothetical protein
MELSQQNKKQLITTTQLLFYGFQFIYIHRFLSCDDGIVQSSDILEIKKGYFVTRQLSFLCSLEPTIYSIALALYCC